MVSTLLINTYFNSKNIELNRQSHTYIPYIHTDVYNVTHRL